MRFKKVEEEEIRLNIAPLIDIIFLLLIFFMVTSHFDVASGIRIRLPKVAKKIYNERADKITLVISKTGQTYFKGKKIDMKSLGKKLQYLINEKGMSYLILHADKGVKLEKIVQIMDLAKTSGVRSIIIAARWKS